MPPTSKNAMEKFLVDVEGLPVLVHFTIMDMPPEIGSGVVPRAIDIHSLLSSTLKKMTDRMRGSSLRRDAPSNQAIVELITSPDPLVRLPALPNETVLRVGPLGLDLLGRTAKRGDRQIDLRPREFQCSNT